MIWRKGRRVVSSYLDVDITKDQCHIFNPNNLDCITCYIMEDDVSDSYLKRLPQVRPNFTYGSISSYCSILNSPKRLEQITQSNKLTSVMCDLDSDRMREQEKDNKR